MKMPFPPPSRITAARLTQQAFTLVEMITVIVVMATLLAIATPHLVHTVQANRLTSAGESLMYRLSRVQQMAATTGKPAEIRFYHFVYEDVSGYHAYQLFAHDEATGQLAALENPIYIKGDNVAFLEGSLSPLLESSAHGAAEGSWPRAAEDEPFRSMGAQYLRITFYPNGSTSLNIPLRASYLTLANDSDAGGGSTAPDNYYTIQIDPVTGRAKSYRP